MSVTNLANLKKNAEYDKYDNLLSYRRYGAGETEKYTYSYGDTDEEKKKHLVKSSKSPEGVCGAYGYDKYGNETAKRVHNSAKSMHIRTTAEYGEKGNYVSKRTDALGKSTVYETDQVKGTLSKITDAKGQSVSYGYDSAKRVTGVSASAGGRNYKNEYTYEKDRLAAVKHNTTGDGVDVRYSFAYDGLGRQTTVKVDNPTNSGAGSQVLSTNVYDAADRSGKLKRVEYGNGGKVHYEYDGFDQLTSVRYDEATSARYEYEYGANGEIARVKDKAQNRAYESGYDLAERPMEGRLTDGNGNVLYQTLLKYNGKNELSAFRENWNGKSYVTKYTYDDDGRTTEIRYAGENQKESIVYDTLGRIKRRELKNGSQAYTTSYEYNAGNNGSNGTHSAQVKKISQSGEVFEYGYDAVGNITTEKRNGASNSYEYDGLGQLTRANVSGQSSWAYEYDRGGNLVSKKKYAYTTGSLGSVEQTIGYEYGNAKWKDQLTKYNGKAIAYDGIGNPVSYDGWTYEWQAGRQLKKMSKSGTTAEYTYDHNGLRVKKVVNGVTTEYMLHGKLVTGVKSGNDVLKIAYDEQSRPAMVEYNGIWYGYVKNLQGDIVGIVDSNGTEAVKYSYDAWGKVMSTSGSKGGTLGKANPFRYRGYVYDEETGLYYAQERYYNPEWCRFISADDSDAVKAMQTEQTDKNLYAYCDNNPIIREDKEGEFWNFAVGAVVGAAIGAATQIISNVASGNNWTDGVGTAVATGAASGLLTASGVGLAGAVVGNAAISMAGNAANQVIENGGFEDFDAVDMLVDGAAGAVSGAIGGSGMGKAVNIRTLNRNLTKKVFYGTTDVAKKGVRYYVSQTKKLYIDKLLVPMRNSAIFSGSYGAVKGMYSRFR